MIAAFPQAVVDGLRAAAREHLRIADSEDDLLGAQARDALELCERFTRHAWIARERSAMLVAERRWQALADGPVTAITRIEGIPAEGARFVLSPQSYAVDIDARGTGWVRLTGAGAAGRIEVSYGAGLAETLDQVPSPLVRGMVLLVAHLFSSDAGTMPPAAVSALWRPWRAMQLADVARFRETVGGR